MARGERQAQYGAAGDAVAMRWRKLGRIFCPAGEFAWLQSHASNPVAQLLPGGVRVYFSSRDRANRSHIGYFEFDPRDPARIEFPMSRPIVEPGASGLFDDSGASVACVVRHVDRNLLYYLGWNLGVTVPWRNSIGLALEQTSGEYVKHSAAPILDRDTCDPYSLSYPWVLREQSVWKMWYGSNLNWGSDQKDMMHVLKYAESDDGIHWRRSGHVAIGLATPDEYAISKPCVIHEGGLYRMWYSYRGESYRIGYAESTDGETWVRMDAEAGIDVSPDGWDSGMIEYPCVFDFEEERYMLYNGNRYGLTGIGLAVLETP